MRLGARVRAAFHRVPVSRSQGPSTADRAPPAISPVVGLGAVEAPTVSWAVPGEIREMCCPNCGSTTPKPKLLTVNFRSPDHPDIRQSAVLQCPECTARFYDNQTVPDYAEAAMLERGRVPFYVQQGAGVSLITRPLAQVDVPAGAEYLEIGCGFGFGLDYAIRTRGWIGKGIDPAQLSAVGRDQLELPIELSYLRDDESAYGRCDVAMASEVIEHVPAPRQFLATLRKLLKPAGLLILTTPNGQDIAPGASSGALVPMLSPGLHLVFQTPESLRRLLLQEGFSQIEVLQDGHSLVAFASDAPFQLQTDTKVLSTAYLAHLLRRAAAVPRGSDLSFAFAGRAMLEAANAADWPAADAAWTLLLASARQRFNLDLAKMTELPAGTAGADLETLSRLMPLNLAALLYADAMRSLGRGVARSKLTSRFRCAAAAADALRQALHQLAMEDGLTEDLGWVCRMEALICQAATGDPRVVHDLADLPPAPGDDGGGARRAIAGRRVFVALVNAGHYEVARTIAQGEGLSTAAFAQQPMLSQVPLEESERDAAFCLAVLDLRAPVDLAAASRRFRRVIHSLVVPGSRALDAASVPGPDALLWAATRGLLSAADRNHDPAIAFAGLRDALSACGDDPALLPEDLAAIWRRRALDQFIRLVGAGDDADAAEVCRLGALRDAATDPSLTRDERHALRFALASLDARGPDQQAALAAFTSLHADLKPKDPLFWPTVRAAVALPESQDDARAALLALTRMIAPADLPLDLRGQLDAGK